LGPTINHKIQALFLYLKSHITSEFTRLFKYDPHKVDSYLSDFEWMSDMTEDEAHLDGIRFLSGMGKRLVKGCLGRIKELRVPVDPNSATSLSTGDKTNGSGLTLNRPATQKAIPSP
jgi:hypothetical protein